MYASFPKSPELVTALVEEWFLLPHDLRAPSAARGLLVDYTEPLAAPARDDLEILVSELTTNAISHGRPVVVLHLTVTSSVVRVEVHDRGATFSVVPAQQVPIDQVSGRGLLIVDSLATAWGIHTPARTAGKCVWFELSLAGVMG